MKTLHANEHIPPSPLSPPPTGGTERTDTPPDTQASCGYVIYGAYPEGNVSLNDRNRWRAPIGLAGYSIAQEHHADGGLYLHALIKLDKKPNIKDSTVYFGLAEGEEVVHHPNIDTNVRNFNVVKEYVRKKHRENIKQAEEAGLLIEHWPDAMDNDGRNKRKVCGFEADEIEEAVKRSRTSEQALRELENLNRGLLAANFNNYKNYIRWTLPQYDFQEYVPDFERRNWILPPHHLMQALVALVINRWCCMAVPG
ncbi:hypothetical protein RhiirC2_791614 [Rhizophagus irregularis]|uniref:CRESS-DNA virus Rep endonuclease domain-containing protein n=1 Tax=Rhizophagus irregularis TaxID=588596 RepID=A0A2N1MIW8_9GLOM|nr:hypothetical protein RhiirC2_791614 [Rhizophagus irregularis]